jgi:hypothetical protein
MKQTLRVGDKFLTGILGDSSLDRLESNGLVVDCGYEMDCETTLNFS